MGYLPPSPPQPGSVLILEPGFDYVEVTALEDSERRFVRGLPIGGVVSQDGDDAWMERRLRMEREADVVKVQRQNMIGTALLIAFVLQAGYCLWSIL